MAKAYGLDLRKKTMDLVKVQKKSVLEVSRLLNISRKTIYEWMKNPTLEQKPRYGRKPSFTRYEALKAYVLAHPTATALEMAGRFKTTDSVIYGALKKIGFSFKKTSTTYKEACPKKQQEFLEVLKKKTKVRFTT